MTIDQVVYFINHLADTNVNQHMIDAQGLVFIVFPVVFALYIVLVKMQKFRGNKVALNFLVLTLYCVFTILPATLMVRSLILLNNIKTIPIILLFFLFFAILYHGLIKEFYPRFSYRTDADYLKAFPLADGSNIITTYPNPKKLQIINELYGLTIAIIFFSYAIYAFQLKIQFYRM